MPKSSYQYLADALKSNSLLASSCVRVVANINSENKALFATPSSNLQFWKTLIAICNSSKTMCCVKERGVECHNNHHRNTHPPLHTLMWLQSIATLASNISKCTHDQCMHLICKWTGFPHDNLPHGSPHHFRQEMEKGGGASSWLYCTPRN